jgi:hypothetical protein
VGLFDGASDLCVSAGGEVKLSMACAIIMQLLATCYPACTCHWMVMFCI